MKARMLALAFVLPLGLALLPVAGTGHGLPDRVPSHAQEASEAQLSPASAEAAAGQHPHIKVFFATVMKDQGEVKRALEELEKAWQPGYAAMLVDLARFLMPPQQSGGGPPQARGGDDPRFRAERVVDDIGSAGLGGTGFAEAPRRAPRKHPSTVARERLIGFLQERTGQKLGHDLRAWRRWLWTQPYVPHPDYSVFKAGLYAQVDQAMIPFFMATTEPQVRLDEVDWGGVQVDGIPPLDHPAVVSAGEATYLADDNVVFGVVLNGEARAYPKRILGWHELARDQVGGVDLTLVYCTLCGTAVPYGSKVGGQVRTFGTSGLLYRSNKLLFDAESQSLWSTTNGRPVIGALAGEKLELRAYPVVTTTWREWRATHPQTTVLALDTGFERDYGEGVAYGEYFANDELMFDVPERDERLKNKDEVLAVLMRPRGQRDADREALAISVALLAEKPVYHVSVAGNNLVVITSPDGANRVYDAGDTRFVRRSDDGHEVFDEASLPWQVGEGALVPDGRDEGAKRRIAARRAFWFGWHAQFPETALYQ